MFVIDSLFDSFEDRHLVLHGLLGLWSASSTLASRCDELVAGDHSSSTASETPSTVSDPIVLLALGLIGFRESLRKELEECGNQQAGTTPLARSPTTLDAPDHESEIPTKLLR